MDLHTSRTTTTQDDVDLLLLTPTSTPTTNGPGSTSQPVSALKRVLSELDLRRSSSRSPCPLGESGEESESSVPPSPPPESTMGCTALAAVSADVHHLVCAPAIVVSSPPSEPARGLACLEPAQASCQAHSDTRLPHSLCPPRPALAPPLPIAPKSHPKTHTTAARFPPPLTPPISLESLRELELDHVLRNPQLRHDLLYDPTLQLQPSATRSRRDASTKYWLAVHRELLLRCRCTAFDAEGRLSHCVCACRSCISQAGGPTFIAPETKVGSVCGWDANSPEPGSQTSTSRSPLGSIPTEATSIAPFPSRIQTLVTELLQVIQSVITPSRAFSPQSLQCTPTIPSVFPSSPDADTSLPIHTHTTLLMRALDPPYTAQLLQHGQLDTPTLSSIFSLIGSILKCHCAPMRDGVVDAMVALARAPLLKETKKDRTKRAIKVFKRCFEIVELMRLDLTNHQLLSLRPQILATCSTLELRVFYEEARAAHEQGGVAGRGVNLEDVRAWLQAGCDRTRPVRDSRRSGKVDGDGEPKKHGSEPKFRSSAPTLAPPLPRSSLAFGASAVGPSCSETSHEPHLGQLSRSKKIQTAFLDALVDSILSFSLPPATDPNTNTHSLPSSGVYGSPSSPFFPDTFAMDRHRLGALREECADITALAMLLLLVRQLRATSLSDTFLSTNRPQAPARQAGGGKLGLADLELIKRHILALVPPHLHMGAGLLSPGDGSDDGNISSVIAEHTNGNQNAVGSIATAALTDDHSITGPRPSREQPKPEEQRHSTSNDCRYMRGELEMDVIMRDEDTSFSDVLLQVTVDALDIGHSTTDFSTTSTTLAPGGIDSHLLSTTLDLVNAWVATNLRPGSSLATLLRTRLKRVLLEKVHELTFGHSSRCHNSSSAVLDGPPNAFSGPHFHLTSFHPISHPQNSTTECSSSSATYHLPSPPSSTPAFDTLHPELHFLSFRIAQIAAYHWKIYHGLYESDRFVHP